MPVIKKDKVDYYYSQLYVKPQGFLQTLPELIKKNMASGDYASQWGSVEDLLGRGAKDFDELSRVTLRRQGPARLMEIK